MASSVSGGVLVDQTLVCEAARLLLADSSYPWAIFGSVSCLLLLVAAIANLAANGTRNSRALGLPD